MPMVKKSITVTSQQDDWIQAQLAKGGYASDSELLRELIRERQAQDQETASQREAIRSALLQGEQSGLSNMGVDEIWAQAKRTYQSKNG